MSNFHFEYRDKLQNMITSHGGLIGSDQDIKKNCSKKECPRDVVIIASPTGFRRPNYLLGLAAGEQARYDIM